MKVLIINLEKDKERFLNITRQLEDYDCYDYHRIDAIYGKNIYKDFQSKITNLSLFDNEVGCYLSQMKAFSQIVDKGYEYALILEDDVTLTDWFPLLPQIIDNYFPKTFDICWVGNSENKWPRNPCNIIPNYDYKKIEKNRINKFVYKIDENNGDNIPIGSYGLVVSNKGAHKILREKNHFSQAIDQFLVRNPNLEKYMTIPSIIIHCYDFGSNIRQGSHLETNPFDNVWKKNKKEETNVLELLENMTNIFQKNNLNYSLAFGTLIGYGRNKKIISYDDDIDTMINKKNLPLFENLIPELKKICNVYKYKKPIWNNTLYYKLYPKEFKIIKGKEFGWPFIDIFIYEFDKNNIIIATDKYFRPNISENFIYDYLHSNDPKNNKKYRIQVLKDYKKILDNYYKDWDKICISRDFDHTREKSISDTYSFNCQNIIPNYSVNTNETFYSKKSKNSKLKISIVIFFCLFLVGFLVYKLKKKKKISYFSERICQSNI